MPLRVNVSAIVPELDGLPQSALRIAGQQAVQELQRQNSLWPVDSGRSKRGFFARVVGGRVIIRNKVDYAEYVEEGVPAARTRNSARRTLANGPARRRIIQAANRGRVSRERAQTEQAAARRRARDERIILEGGPDSRLSREGRLREAARRRRNRRSRRRYRLARALNDQPRAVRPWERLSGAEINEAARLASYMTGDLQLGPASALRAFGGIEDPLARLVGNALTGDPRTLLRSARIIRQRRIRSRPPSARVVSVALQIASRIV